MYKVVTERPKGYLRKVTHTVLYCDGCEKRINWGFPYSSKQYCEDCYTALKNADKNNKNIKRG